MVGGIGHLLEERPHRPAGHRSVGDTLAENSYSDGRTARLASTYDAEIQGEHILLPAGTPFVARSAPIPVAVDGTAPHREPRAAPGTVVWCALPQSGNAPCFLWDAADGVHGHALMTGGAPSERGARSARGFALVRDGGGHPLRTAAAVQPGTSLDIEFADGRVGATAQGVSKRIESPPYARPRPRTRRGGSGGSEGQGSLFG